MQLNDENETLSVPESDDSMKLAFRFSSKCLPQCVGGSERMFLFVSRLVLVSVWSGAKVCKSCRDWKMLSNAYLLAKFRFDTAENEPAKNLQNFRKMHFRKFIFWKFLMHPRRRGPLHGRQPSPLWLTILAVGCVRYSIFFKSLLRWTLISLQPYYPSRIWKALF